MGGEIGARGMERLLVRLFPFFKLKCSLRGVVVQITPQFRSRLGSG